MQIQGWAEACGQIGDASRLAALLRAGLAELDALPPAEFVRPGRWGGSRAGLELGPRSMVLQHLVQDPEVAPLFLCHHDGYVRAGALAALTGPLTHPNHVIALAWRLNDWVGAVRAMAMAGAARVLPQTDPRVIATALMVLVLRLPHWRRWQDGGALDAAVARPDVAAAPTGPMVRVLGALLRHPSLDPHLAALAEGARQPGVRALATDVLIAGTARWPQGHARGWIDKSIGRFRRVPVWGSRPVACPIPIEALIQAAARDRAAPVRRVAAAAIEAHGPGLSDRDGLIALLAADRSPAVRARIDWVQRHRAGWTVPGPAA